VLAVRQVESRIAGADCGEVLFLKSAKKTKDAQEKSRKVKAFAERFLSKCLILLVLVGDS
jgi:hypothetical protein